MPEDIYDNSERVDFEEEYEEDILSCFNCGWYGNDPYVIKSFGMEWTICPVCSSEVV